MRICKNCGKEVRDEDIFCPYCGAELEAQKKKLSFIEKREAKEREKQFLLSKASIQPDDVKDAENWDLDYLKIEEKGDGKKAKTISLTKIIIEVVIATLCIAIAEVVGRGAQTLNNNIKLLIIFLCFISVAICVAFFIGEVNYFRLINKMIKSEIAIKKMRYGANPTMFYKGKLYEIFAIKACPKCGQETHIEEYDGSLYVVCNRDRQHLYKIDTIKLSNDFIEKRNNSDKEMSI